MLDSLFRASLWALGRLPDDAIRSLARGLFSRSWRLFEEASERPRAAQEARLALLVDRARDTAFGREHGFDSVKSLADYQRRVPIRSWEEIAPYVERMLAGEERVLIPDAPFYFARSSGTTGTPKSIPVTPAYLAEFRLPRRVWTRQVVQAFPGLVRGKILGVHSPRIEGHTTRGVPYGSITVAMSGSPDAPGLPVSRFSLDPSPRRVFLLQDFELKYYLTLLLAAQEDVRLCAAINPSTLVLLAKKLDQHAERLARELEAGRTEALEGLGEPLQSEVRARLRRAPAAARRILESKARHGRVLPTDLWPQIQGLIAWKGGSAPFYLSQLEQWFPGKRVMDYGYLATEGGFSIPLSPEGASGVVAAHGHLLEFVPEEARARGESGPALLADELEVGARYRVIISGSHGLYRYDINDVVECVGFYRRTAEIAFVHKGGNMLSMTGEKIGERHVVEAFEAARAETGLAMTGFTVSIELSDPPRYLFAVEPEAPLDEAGAQRLLAAVERGLRAANLEYAAKRDSLRLWSPKLIVLEPGAFERSRRARVLAGAPESHVKIPHLMRDRREVEALGVRSEVESQE